MTFSGNILIIGAGTVARCVLPLLLRRLAADRSRITVLECDAASPGVAEIRQQGIAVRIQGVTRDNMRAVLGGLASAGDLILDLAFLGTLDVLRWCHEHGVCYINASVEEWESTNAPLSSHYRAIRALTETWRAEPGPTAIVDHGANPGWISHVVKIALDRIAASWLRDRDGSSELRTGITEALHDCAYNRLAQALGVTAIHVSEVDSQVSKKPKRYKEFVNTWSVQGFYEEALAAPELGWGTHEARPPPGGSLVSELPRVLKLEGAGCHTWTRSWVPSGEFTGMLLRHGETFSIAEHLSVVENGAVVYQPTVCYVYLPCAMAVASLIEVGMQHGELQSSHRIMTDEIEAGEDELGCLVVSRDGESWWAGSILSTDQAREHVPHQNATALQVAAGVVAAATWVVRHPDLGVLFPDDLPHWELFLSAAPFLGRFVSQRVDWTPGSAVNCLDLCLNSEPLCRHG